MLTATLTLLMPRRKRRSTRIEKRVTPLQPAASRQRATWHSCPGACRDWGLLQGAPFWSREWFYALQTAETPRSSALGRPHRGFRKSEAPTFVRTPRGAVGVFVMAVTVRGMCGVSWRREMGRPLGLSTRGAAGWPTGQHARPSDGDNGPRRAPWI